MRRFSGRRGWRSFHGRDARRIRRDLSAGVPLCCPCCDDPLEHRGATRMAAVLPSGVNGFDLECRACRRFCSQVRHTPESLYLLRIHKLAAAVLRA
jgi:hypothetical protein